MQQQVWRKKVYFETVHEFFLVGKQEEINLSVLLWFKDYFPAIVAIKRKQL